MSNIGVFFALSALELAAMEGRVLRGEHRDWANETYIERQAEAPSRMLNVDVAWDAIHRCLGDGSLTEDPTDYPMRAVILGGHPLGNDPAMIMRLNTPDTVRDIAPKIMRIDEPALRSCYFSIDAYSYLIVPNEADFQYTWTYFQQVQSFYGRAAETGEAVLFTADQ